MSVFVPNGHPCLLTRCFYERVSGSHFILETSILRGGGKPQVELGSHSEVLMLATEHTGVCV